MSPLHIVQTWINLVCTDLVVQDTAIAGGHVQPRSACAYCNNVGFRQGCTSIPVTALTLHVLCLYGVKYRLWYTVCVFSSMSFLCLQVMDGSSPGCLPDIFSLFQVPARYLLAVSSLLLFPAPCLLDLSSPWSLLAISSFLLGQALYNLCLFIIIIFLSALLTKL